MIIAVDFDGTIVEDDYPRIGAERPCACEVLRQLKREGYILILWTCRTGNELAAAIAFCKEEGVRFDAVNENLRSEIVRYHGSNPRKVGASMYIEDRGHAELPGWEELYKIIHRRCPTDADLLDIEYGNSK